MKLSILIPTFERQDLLRQCVEALKASEMPEGTEVLVLCEGRDDGSAGYAAAQGCRAFASEQAVSFSAANNRLAKEASPDADWLLLLNNDCCIQPGFWAALEQMAEAYYDMVGAKLLYPDGRIQHYGKWFTLDGYPFHVLRFQPGDHAEAQAIRAMPDVTFACVAIKRLVWDSLGGLDEGYVNGFEDDDFCMRARERGGQIGVHPGMVAIHKESQTTGLDTANKEVQWQRFQKAWVESGRISWPLGVHQGWRSVT